MNVSTRRAMRAFRTNLGAGLDSLVVREEPQPQPGDYDVLIRVRACSINRRDTMIVIEGRYPLPVRENLIPLSDGAGEVVAVGARVTRVKPGDRVAANVFARWVSGAFDFRYAAQLGGSLDGMLAEYAVAPEESLVPIPEHLSFAEACTLPCAGVTAWNALTGETPAKAGDTVVTLGSGGVSIFAVQFAKLFGARVIATTSSNEKGAVLRGLGADYVVNYRDVPNWSDAVREITGGRGAERIVEVGGAGTMEQSIKCAAFEGHIALVGALAAGSFDGRALSAGVYTLRRLAVGSRTQFEAMNRAIALHRARPLIDRVFRFDEARDAFEYFTTRDSTGKVVITVP